LESVPLVDRAVVPLAHRAFSTVEGPYAADSPWRDFLNMAGFYGGYAVLAGTVGSGVHTWLVRRSPGAGPGVQILWAACIGLVVLLPQAAVFGRGYWLINAAAGALAGLLYGALVTLVPGFGQPATEMA
jgi:hypothetical protein